MPEGNKVRIRVRTVRCTYVEGLLVPPSRHHISVVTTDRARPCVKRTNARVSRRDRVSCVAPNNSLTESIAHP